MNDYLETLSLYKELMILEIKTSDENNLKINSLIEITEIFFERMNIAVRNANDLYKVKKYVHVELCKFISLTE